MNKLIFCEFCGFCVPPTIRIADAKYCVPTPFALLCVKQKKLCVKQKICPYVLLSKNKIET